jgi:hypothetical protein
MSYQTVQVIVFGYPFFPDGNVQQSAIKNANGTQVAISG